MTRLLVLYYSSWGHVETMAEAVADGARSVPGMHVDVKRVPELVPDPVARAAHYKTEQRGQLVGKVGSVFAVTGTQHGGQETALTSFHTTLFHHGMVVVGLPYTFEGLVKMDEITGGTPYGATALAGGDGSRTVSANELAGARFQGRYVATVARELALGRVQRQAA